MKNIRYPNKDLFNVTLRNRVKSEIARFGRSRTGWLHTKNVVIILLYIGIYGLLMTTQLTFGGILLLYGLLGGTLALAGFNIMHDASHGALFKTKSANKITVILFECISGASHFLWELKHVRIHHMYTNTHHDDDVRLYPTFRVHRSDTRLPIHRIQAWYALPLYCLLLLSWVFYFDLKKYFKRKIAEKEIKFTTRDHLLFWLGKLSHFTIMIVIPCIVLGPVAIVGYLVYSAVCGFLLSVIFQLAHVVNETTFNEPDKDGIMKKSWAVTQVEETIDFGTRNRVLTILLGGLNFQTIHHLFPEISHVHYPHIQKVVEETCREFGVPYQKLSFIQAFWSHLTFLNKRGKVT